MLECLTRGGSSEQEAKLQLNWCDAAGEVLREQIEVIRSTSQWGPYRRRVVAPPLADHVTLYITALDPGTVWFDDVFFGEAK
jgi:hypothetical protein